MLTRILAIVCLALAAACRVQTVRLTAAHGELAKAANDRLAEDAARAQAIADAVQRDRDVTTRVVTKYVDRVHVIVQRGRTLVEQVPVYVSSQADAACVVPAGFVRLHDAAAQGTELPAAATGAAAAASGVALSAVAATVAGNYTTCRATAARLMALQTWAREVSR